MRTIHTDDIIKNIKEMCIAVNVKLSPDVRNAILTARENEESEIGSQMQLLALNQWTEAGDPCG